ncbi:hypothetical protein TWF281_004599 [Arthrobotrys megalospora]
MGQFDPKKYDYGGDFNRSIVTAREDLEKDYPGARVFINYTDSWSPSVRTVEIQLAAPDGQSSVIRGSFEVPRTGLLKSYTYGYQYTVFSEGTLKYGGKIDGSGWATWSDHYHANIEHGSLNMKTFTWRRQDGSTRFRTVSFIDLANWMGKLSDDLYLSQITIPATHDSHAMVGTPIVPWEPITELFAGAKTAAECQGWSVKDQLKNGIRSLDLRYGDNLNMRHGQVELPGNLRDCIRDVTKFLDAHPKETVVVMAKWDKWAFRTNDEFVEDEETRAKANKLFTDSPRFLDTSEMPTLKECRGKFIRKLEGKGNTQGLNFDKFPIPASFQRPGTSFPPFVSKGLTPKESQWAWESWRLEDSWLRNQSDLNWNLYVGQNLAKEQATTVMGVGLNDYHMDTTSVLTGTSIFPVKFASYKNGELLKWLTKNCGLAKIYPLGFVAVDFADKPGQQLLTKLVLTNFT